jgi:hypothetical protein
MGQLGQLPLTTTENLCKEVRRDDIIAFDRSYRSGLHGVCHFPKMAHSMPHDQFFRINT